ncbi:MAG: ABC transporter ATP-binding protein [Acidimicrobiales bacterium]
MEDGNTPAPSPAVVCEDVVIRYGDTVAVNRLSFSGHAGEVVALLGPNGAGKTSTVEALEGYRAIDSGSLRVLGLDPRRDHAALVPHIGVMLQRGGIYPMLGSTQVLHLFSRYYDDPEDPDMLIELVGLGPVRRTPWRRLSGGEQQRLSLALALVGKPDVLFLDEPTAGVDPEGRLAVRSIIADQRDRGICVILTTHELTEAERLADQVIIIDRGRILAEGTPSDLASGSADGSIRFTATPGIDTGLLVGALTDSFGRGAVLAEDPPGSYRLAPPTGAATPAVIAVLAGWLAERDLALGDLRTGRSLEEAYLAITGSRDGAEPADAGSSDAGSSERTGQSGPADRAGRSERNRRGREGGRSRRSRSSRPRDERR